MSKFNIRNLSFKLCNKLLDEMLKHPEKVSEDDILNMQSLSSKLDKNMGVSEHTKWCVTWQLDKWKSALDKLAGKEPYETLYDSQNIVLDLGANEMLKLITGNGGTTYSASNGYIYVGTDSTAENASQSGIQASGDNKAYAGMDSGYPVVNGRQAIFSSSFGEDTANFKWKELSVVNGIGANAIALNRKVNDKPDGWGTKSGGVWTMRMTLTLNSL